MGQTWRVEPSEEIRRVIERFTRATAAGHALGGEILVSAVVRDLVAGGSDVAFLERSDVELKGIEGTHRLFAVDLTSSPTVS